ncbi:MAG TPA: hypothetical protein VJ891_17380 [Casimicrobiaceae bacterium]|nr:hypothetical protein [Casimicrobiaceae bacterium]
MGEADSTRERRVKALTCTRPLHELQTNRGLRGWSQYDFYDLGLAAIDLVVDRMGFDTGISREDLDRELLDEVRRFAPEASEDELTRVASEIIETLVRPNIGEYTSAIDAMKRRHDFVLLTEHEDAERRIYLRATKEAINVLIGGLNTDIESAQVAAEATLEHLIRRRRFDSAEQPARAAKIRSVQYEMFVRQVIDETKRDVRRAGWRDQVPERLSEIRQHLDERMDTERRLLNAMQDARDTAVREDLRQQAAALVEIVDECFERHKQLHAMTMRLIRIFVEEQDRQVFGRAAAVGAIDLTDEVLEPILGLCIGEVGDAVVRFAERIFGIGPGPNSAIPMPLLPRFGAFLVALLRPPPARDGLGDAVEEPEWEDAIIDPFAFTPEEWALADEMLTLDAPVRLADLLEQAATEHGRRVADLVRLRAIVAVAPDLEAVRPNARPVLAAVIDEQTFDRQSFAGTNLLLGTLVAHADAPRAAGSNTTGLTPPAQLPLIPIRAG